MTATTETPATQPAPVPTSTPAPAVVYKCPDCDFIPKSRTQPEASLKQHQTLMHGAKKWAPAIDVHAPVTADSPAVWTGLEAEAPTDLPRNLASTIPAPFPFNWIAIFHHPVSLVLFVGLVGITVYEYVFLTRHLPLLWAVIAPLVLVSLTVALPAKVAPGIAVRKAIVVRKVPSGLTEVDEQKWWWHEAAKWSDEWRWIFEYGSRTKPKLKRVLVIDAQAYDYAAPDRTKLRPVNPWLAPLPVRPANLDSSVPFHSPSPAELGMTWALGKAVREWLDVRDPWAERMNQMMLGILIGVSFLALYLGGDRIGVLMEKHSQGSSEAALAAEVQKQLQAEILNLAASGEFRATPTPAP